MKSMPGAERSLLLGGRKSEFIRSVLIRSTDETVGKSMFKVFEIKGCDVLFKLNLSSQAKDEFASTIYEPLESARLGGFPCLMICATCQAGI
jgi:hypothetical protein